MRKRKRDPNSFAIVSRYTHGVVMMKVRWVGRQKKVMSMCPVVWRSSAKSRWFRCLGETVTQLHWPPMEKSTAGEYLEYVHI